MTVRRWAVVLAVLATVVVGSAGTASAQYAPNCTAAVSSVVVAPGGTVTVSHKGGCFMPGSTVTITMYSDPVVLGTAIADSLGNVEATVTIPTGAALGSHLIELAGTGRDGQPTVMGVSIAVQLSSLGTGATGTSTGTPLPVTGTESTGLATAGVALVVAGGLVVLATRKRRTIAA